MSNLGTGTRGGCFWHPLRWAPSPCVASAQGSLEGLKAAGGRGAEPGAETRVVSGAEAGPGLRILVEADDGHSLSLGPPLGPQAPQRPAWREVASEAFSGKLLAEEPC